MASSAQERVVYIRPRTVLVVLGILLATLGILAFVYLAWHIITWILIAVFLALALNPAVEFFQRHGLRRGYSTAIVFILAVGAIAGSPTGAVMSRILRAASSGSTFADSMRCWKCWAKITSAPQRPRAFPIGWCCFGTR